MDIKKSLQAAFFKFIRSKKKKTIYCSYSKIFISVIDLYNSDLKNDIYSCSLFFDSGSYVLTECSEEYKIGGAFLDYFFDRRDEQPKEYIDNALDFCKLREILKRTEELELGNKYRFIPVAFSENSIDYIAMDSEKFARYFKVEDSLSFFLDYPVFCAIMNWGIKMKRNQGEHIFDVTPQYPSIPMVAEGVFKELNLPNLYTVQAYANLNYEKRNNKGHIKLVYANGKSVPSLFVKFRAPFFLDEINPRAIRKYIELSGKNISLVFEREQVVKSSLNDDSFWKVVGLDYKCSIKDCFSISFLGSSAWNLKLKNEVIVYDGTKYSYRRITDRELTEDNELELSPFFDRETKKKAINIINICKAQSHGTMLVFSKKAKEETQRLCKCGRGMEIDCLRMSQTGEEKLRDFLLNISSIDGAILFDEKCNCYSIGVILDGEAVDNSNPGRGARYNSGYTYCKNCESRRIDCIVVVISEDGMLDIFHSKQ